MSNTAKTFLAPKINLQDLDWDTILQKGAESLAQSLGSTIGGGLGKAFVDAILGRAADEEAFRNEVISTLARVEAKIDKIISFLYDQLPKIVKQQVDLSLVHQEIRELRAKIVTVDGILTSLSNLDREPNQSEISLLIQAGNSSFEMGIRILQSGQEWYAAGIHAYTSGFAAYAKLIKHAPHFGAALVNYSREYLKLITPWLTSNSPDSTSFVDLLVRLPNEQKLANEAVTPMLDSLTFIALGCYVFQNSIKPPIEMRWVAHGGWFQIASASGSLQCKVVAAYVDDLKDYETRDARVVIEACASPKWRISPLWPEPIVRVGVNFAVADYDSFLPKLNWARDAYQNHSARITAVQAAVASLVPFQTACSAQSPIYHWH